VRASLVLLVVLGACAADAPSSQEPGGPPAVQLLSDSTPAQMSDSAPADDAVDVCALAAALPADDICSLVCDPDALEAQLAADGSEPGTCIQLYCQLTDTVHVLAGVCIAPQ
jgi:hypothetical protein